MCVKSTVDQSVSLRLFYSVAISQQNHTSTYDTDLGVYLPVHKLQETPWRFQSEILQKQGGNLIPLRTLLVGKLGEMPILQRPHRAESRKNIQGQDN